MKLNNKITNLLLTWEELKHINRHKDCVQVLQKAAGSCTSLVEVWYIENLKLFSSCKAIGNELSETEKVKELHFLQKELFQLLSQEQGVPVSSDTIYLEVVTAINYVRIHQMLDLNWNADAEQSDYNNQKVLITLLRVLEHFNENHKRNDDTLECPIVYRDLSSLSEVFNVMIQILNEISTGEKKNNDGVPHFCILWLIIFLLLKQMICVSWRLEQINPLLLENLTSALQRCIELSPDTKKCTRKITSIETLSPFLFSMDQLGIKSVIRSIICLMFASLQKFEKAAAVLTDFKQENNRAHLFEFLLKGYLCMQMNDWKEAEASFICCCKSGKSFQENDVVSLARNGLGICMLHEDKPALALQTLKSAAFDSVTFNKGALLIILLALNKLQMYDAEIQALKLLVKLCRTEMSPGFNCQPTLSPLSELIMILRNTCLLPFSDSRVIGSCNACFDYMGTLDEATILHRLCDRLFQRKRYDEAADGYLDLLRLVVLGDFPKVCKDNGTETLIVYYRCISGLILDARYEEAIRICDHVLRKELPFVAMVERMGNGIEDKSMAFSQITLPVDAVAVILKAEAQRQRGNISDALESLNRIREMIASTEDTRRNNVEPVNKKRKMEDTFSKPISAYHLLNSLKTQMYNSLGLVHLKMQNKDKGFQMFVEGIKALRGGDVSEEIKYNLCKILYTKGKKVLALKNWNAVSVDKISETDLDGTFAPDFKAILPWE